MTATKQLKKMSFFEKIRKNKENASKAETTENEVQNSDCQSPE